MFRTPPKPKTKMEENIEMMMNMMRKMNDKINVISTEIKKKRWAKGIREDIEKLRTENKKLVEENSTLKKTMNVEDRLERMERGNGRPYEHHVEISGKLITNGKNRKCNKIRRENVSITSAKSSGEKQDHAK